MNKTFTYILIFLLVLLTSFYIVRKLKKTNIPQINLVDIVLVQLDGKTIDNKQFIGKPLIINFWGTWCGPCREELPNFEKAQKTYGNKITIIAVSDESADAIVKFKSENDYHFMYAQSQKHFNALGLTSVPFTYFYDAKGKLISKQKDALSEVELDKLIKKLLP